MFGVKVRIFSWILFGYRICCIVTPLFYFQPLNCKLVHQHSEFKFTLNLLIKVYSTGWLTLSATSNDFGLFFSSV